MAAADTTGTGVSQLPILGKLAGMTPRSVQASLDKNEYGTDLDTYASCLVDLTAPVVGLVAVKMSRIPPMRSTGDPVTVLRLVETGNRESTLTPSVASRLTGIVTS